eukprot:3473770-Pyramimonas_sp.AAC.1
MLCRAVGLSRGPSREAPRDGRARDERGPETDMTMDMVLAAQRSQNAAAARAAVSASGAPS